MAASKPRSRSNSARARSKSRSGTKPSAVNSVMWKLVPFLWRLGTLLLLVLILLASLSSPNWYYCRPILDGQALECMPTPHQLQIELKKNTF